MKTLTQAELIDKTLGANVTKIEQQFIDKCIELQRRYDSYMHILQKCKNQNEKENILKLIEICVNAHDDRYHHVSWAPGVRRLEEITLE